LYGGAWGGLSESFYPLQLGNHWQYRKHFVYAVIPNEGDPSPPYELDATIDRELICVEHRDARDYVVEQAEEQDLYQSIRSWIRFRQDRSGLYEADVSIQDPPSCAVPWVPRPGGGGSETSAGLVRRLDALMPAGPPARHAAFQDAVERMREKLALVDAVLGTMARPSVRAAGAQLAGPGELTRLRYPLHPGARWFIRNEPGATFMARVEGTDALALPAGRLKGYRIRISFDGLGPDDNVRVWYGTSGLLQLVVHVESEAIDVFGQPQGWVIVDQRESLEALRLSGGVVTQRSSGNWPLSR
jgi:hypothetical protein